MRGMDEPGVRKSVKVGGDKEGNDNNNSNIRPRHMASNDGSPATEPGAHDSMLNPHSLNP